MVLDHVVLATWPTSGCQRAPFGLGQPYSKSSAQQVVSSPTSIPEGQCLLQCMVDPTASEESLAGACTSVIIAEGDTLLGELLLLLLLLLLLYLRLLT